MSGVAPVFCCERDRVGVAAHRRTIDEGQHLQRAVVAEPALPVLDLHHRTNAALKSTATILPFGTGDNWK